MNIHFKTFGCKVNLYETENMKQNFAESGYNISDKESGSEIFVINTCTVTETGDKKVFKELRRLRREYPGSIIAVTGCYPQAFPDKAKEIPEADIIAGTKNRKALPDIVSEYIRSKEKQVNICEYSQNDKFEEMCNSGYENNTRGFIKIQDGCNMFCTYCIIPYSRGHFRSKPLEALKKEAALLAESGCREIVLAGINLSFYGTEYGLRLADAVEAVCAVDGIERVRLGSLEPEIINDADIKRLSAQKKLCPHFHLSLQSGCDKTLKAMNRRYDAAAYRNLVGKLRENFEDCSITTDVMVGFPGETDEDFEQSVKFVSEIGFSKVHIFPYSPRDGTPAAKYPDQIPEGEKNIRARKMALAAEAGSQKFLKSQLGRTFPVLFERERADKIPHGYTPNYTQVKIFTKISEKSLRNRIFYVKIEGAENDYCFGKIISEQKLISKNEFKER